MKKYLLKRLLMAIPIFFGMTVIVYIMASLAPGTPLDALLADPGITAADIERRRRELGLDQPVIVQYLNWLMQLLRGNLGFSYRTYAPVLEMVGQRIGPTLLLTLTSMAVSVAVAIPLGVMAAYKPYSPWDYFSSGLSFVGAATPNFFVGLVLIFLFSVKLGVLPTGGMYDSLESRNFLSLLRHLIMPVIVLALQQMGSYIRQTRSSMLEILDDDYIRTARSKGLREHVVVLRHGLRNALIPVVTQLGINIPFLVGGAVVTEQIFGWQGLGSLMVQSISMRDYPVIMGVTVVISLGVLLGNIMLDIVYGFLDPRIRYN